MKKKNRRNTSFVILCFLLLSLAVYYLSTRQITLPDRLIPVQYHWLDAVNIYLKTGKILMGPEEQRIDPQAADKTLVYYYTSDSGKMSLVPLEEVSGDDQGYTFILSLAAKIFGADEITYEWFIKFNYFYLVFFGILTSLLLFWSFGSVILSALFFFAYLFIFRIYWGIVDTHWMLGAYIPFYLAFLMWFVLRQKTFKMRWFGLYFLIAGVAETIRIGDGKIGVILFVSLLILMGFAKGYKKIFSKFNFKHHIFKRYLVLAIFFALVYSLPGLVIEGVRNWRDAKYFEGKHSNIPSHHLLWHHAYLGIGFSDNPWGVKYDDYDPITIVNEIDPSARRYSYKADAILRKLYIAHFIESPDFWFFNTLAKLRTIFNMPSIWVSKFLIASPLLGNLANYSVFIIFGLMFFLSRKSKELILISWVILISAIVNLLAPLVVVPVWFYLYGYQATLFMAFFYLSVLLYFRFRKFLTVG